MVNDNNEDIENLKPKDTKEQVAIQPSDPFNLGNPFQKGEQKEDLQKAEDPNIPEKMVEKVHELGMKNLITGDEELKKAILSVAKTTIENEIEKIRQKSYKNVRDVTYDVNVEACKNYGVDESVPVWQQKLMRIGSAFWFIVYWLFASVTIAPVNVFFRGIKTFIKINWLVLALAIFCYILLIVGIPLAVTFFGKI